MAAHKPIEVCAEWQISLKRKKKEEKKQQQRVIVAKHSLALLIRFMWKGANNDRTSIWCASEENGKEWKKKKKGETLSIH